MPWNSAQHRLFQSAAHNPKIARSSGIPQVKAAKMAAEGIKPSKTKMLAKAIRGMR